MKLSPAMKRFVKAYQPVYDGIASVDIDQEDREKIAKEVGQRLAAAGHRDFKLETFVLLASDPLVPCAGYDEEPCPNGTVIRQAMHWSGNPDGSGRSDIWSRRAPYGQIRCVTCGAKHFNPNYPRAARFAQQEA